MALFSKYIGFEDKITFIFKIFDFNEFKSLTITDSEFMFISCAMVTYKLLGIKSSLRDDLVVSFVHEEFEENSRTNISQIKKWATNSKPML